MYIKGKIQEINENIIIIENSNLGYCGKLISSNVYNKNDEVTLWYLLYKSEYFYKYLFFDNYETWNISTKIIELNNVGFKTIEKLFINLNYDNLIIYSINYDIESLISMTRIASTLIKKIVEVIRKEILNLKFTQKQLTIIDSLYKLGYKLSSIYIAISKIDFKLKDEVIIKEALCNLNENN
ncbi:Holliday junction DNA helicase RuvA [Spiroplasma corruscae]|uniref:Holliday junction DNA helicase RuvA n=1 Tax=Spiroplasma corruscae TaxID=216934 RepID=A0A222EP58_9MOLU|nr:hypothetical protein [Spiroplasma corruscae]ASP28277.1 Holliday junction DNA helicase RuvA [Spiroplasma corruscae]